jgi:hypothetical protein
VGGLAVRALRLAAAVEAVGQEGPAGHADAVVQGVRAAAVYAHRTVSAILASCQDGGAGEAVGGGVGVPVCVVVGAALGADGVRTALSAAGVDERAVVAYHRTEHAHEGGGR